MTPTDIASDLYAMATRRQLTSGIDQWGSLISTSQYRLPYVKTLATVPKSARCLDWGCGNGHFSFFLTESGYTTQAFSFQNTPAILSAQPLFTHAQGRPSDPFSLPYAPQTFDAVFSMGVLEHVHESGGDQARSVQEIERILKPGGLFLVFHLPNQYSWIEFLVRVLRRSTDTQKHAHSRLFTRQSFEALLVGTSFEVLSSGRYNAIPRNSFNRLPKALANTLLLCRIMDLLDDVFAALAPMLCQNWFFILRKRSS